MPKPTPIETLIKYSELPTTSPSASVKTATLFFAGQRFYAELISPRNSPVDCQQTIRKSLEAMVLVGLATWVDGDMRDDEELESGDVAHQARSKPIGRQESSKRISRSLDSAPISPRIPSSPIQPEGDTRHAKRDD